MGSEVRKGFIGRENLTDGLPMLIRGVGPVVLDYDACRDGYSWIPLEDMPAHSEDNVRAIRAALGVAFGWEVDE